MVEQSLPVWQTAYASGPAEARGTAAAVRVSAVRDFKFIVVLTKVRSVEGGGYIGADRTASVGQAL